MRRRVGADKAGVNRRDAMNAEKTSISASLRLSRLCGLIQGTKTKQMKTIALVGILILAVATVQATPAASATNPPPPSVMLQDFKLVGDLSGDRAVFTLDAIANVESSKGGWLDLLSGALALTEVGAHPKWQLRAEQGRYVAVFERGGKFPVQIKFTAAVKQSGNWNAVDFRVAPGAVQPITLQGLGADTQFEFAGAARPERAGSNFVSF